MLFLVMLLTLVLGIFLVAWVVSQIPAGWYQVAPNALRKLREERPRTMAEKAFNAAILLSPVIILGVLLITAATSGGSQLSHLATAAAGSSTSSLGMRAMAPAPAVLPLGSGHLVRAERTSTLQDLSHVSHIGQQRPQAGPAGGGITAAIAPRLWQPDQPQAAPVPPRTPKQCNGSSQGCAAQRNAFAAWQQCLPRINAIAPAHHWRFSPIDQRFDSFDSTDPPSAVITFEGTGLLVRDGTGMWRERGFSCAFDTATDAVVAVHIEPLRLTLGKP